MEVMVDVEQRDTYSLSTRARKLRFMCMAWDVRNKLLSNMPIIDQRCVLGHFISLDGYTGKDM